MATRMQKQEALYDFQQAYRRNLRRRVMNQVLRQPAQLSDVNAALQQVEIHRTVDRGVQTIDLDQVQGTAAANHSFDRDFLPTRKSMRHRWARVREAYFDGGGLPAIDVIQVGETYFVQDGHHRVSVARFMGQAFIDAHVTEHVIANSSPLGTKCATDARLLHACESV